MTSRLVLIHNEVPNVIYLGDDYLPCRWDDSPARDYGRLRQAGLSEYLTGHYAKAEEFIRKALDLAETINNEYEVALSYSALGDIQQAERQFADAERDYRKAISLLSLQHGSNYAVAVVWKNLAGTLTDEGQYNDALAAVKRRRRRWRLRIRWKILT